MFYLLQCEEGYALRHNTLRDNCVSAHVPIPPVFIGSMFCFFSYCSGLYAILRQYAALAKHAEGGVCEYTRGHKEFKFEPKYEIGYTDVGEM